MDDDKPNLQKDESRIQFRDVEAGRGIEGPVLQRQLTDGMSIRSISTARSPQLAVEYRTLYFLLPILPLSRPSSSPNPYANDVW